MSLWGYQHKKLRQLEKIVVTQGLFQASANNIFPYHFKFFEEFQAPADEIAIFKEVPNHESYRQYVQGMFKQAKKLGLIPRNTRALYMYRHGYRRPNSMTTLKEGAKSFSVYAVSRHRF